MSSKIDTAADKVQQTADSFAQQGGVKAKLAKPLADDAEFIRKLKPDLIVKRAKGELPTGEKPAEGRVAPPGPQPAARPKSKKKGGPNPWLVIGIAFVVGITIARVVDWRGHGYPRE